MQIYFKQSFLPSGKTFLKDSENINIKNYTSYHFINNSGNHASGGTSILVKNDIPQSKIDLNITLQRMAIRASIYKTITICFVYIPPNDPIVGTELDKLLKQLPKPFILMGDFNHMWLQKY